MNELILPFFQLETATNAAAVRQIMELNSKSADYYLVLSKEEALALVDSRNQILGQLGRIEIGSATIGKLIDVFCDSAYINQHEYVEILNQLLELFYYMKNETLDLIGDDDLIDIMRDCFENRCMGSLELLRYREMEGLAKKIRFGKFYEEEEPELAFDSDEKASSESDADYNGWRWKRGK